MTIVTGLELYVLDCHKSGAGRSNVCKARGVGGVESKPRARVAEIYAPIRSPTVHGHVHHAPSSPNLHCQS